MQPVQVLPVLISALLWLELAAVLANQVFNDGAAFCQSDAVGIVSNDRAFT